MSTIQKIIAIIMGVLATAGVVITIFIILGTQKPDEPIVDEEPKLDCPMVDGVVTYSGKEDKTALELLASICEIETKESADGTIITVTAIDGIATTAPDFWAFYINDAYALTSPNRVQTTADDTIKWQLESVGN